MDSVRQHVVAFDRAQTGHDHGIKAIWVFTIPHQTQVLLQAEAVAELGNKLLLV